VKRQKKSSYDFLKTFLVFEIWEIIENFSQKVFEFFALKIVREKNLFCI